MYRAYTSYVSAVCCMTLFFKYMFEKTQDRRYYDAALSTAYYIADQAEPVPLGSGQTGKRWYAFDSEGAGYGGKGYFPGYFHGTAGSAYLLAEIYELSGVNEFMDLAKAGASYIMDIADEDPNAYGGEGAALVRYNDPLFPDIYYIGQCQGAAGTSKLFYKLYELTREKAYFDEVIKLTNGMIASGAPAKHSRGFWHVENYCCGAAGMLEHFLHVYDLTGNGKYYDKAMECADILVRDSFNDDGQGRRWYTVTNRHMPQELLAPCGLYNGSLGIANSLLELYNHNIRHKELPGYIDDPYRQRVIP